MGNKMRPSQLAVMGDPHGHYDETLNLLQDTGYLDEHLHWVGDNRKLVCVGDYIDRGEKGIETINLFMDLQKQAGSDTVITLLGNHDVLTLSAYYFGHQKSGGPGGNFYDDWVMNGGRPCELEKLCQTHIEWLSELPAMLLIDDILITHADSMLYLNYGKTVEAVNETCRDLLKSKNPNEWDLFLDRFSDRLTFYNNPECVQSFLKVFGGNKLVHGHTPLHYMNVEKPFKPFHYANGKCINVDACAYQGNPLIMYHV